MAEIQSNQSALEYSDVRDIYKFKDEEAVEDLMFLKTDVLTIIGLINKGEFTPLQGVGSPEGVVESNSSLQYIDTALSPVSVTMYANSETNSKTGWIPVV